MKTVLTENWILDGAKYLFSTEKFHFVERPKLFQFVPKGQTTRRSRRPRASFAATLRIVRSEPGAAAAAANPATLEVPLQGTTVTPL